MNNLAIIKLLEQKKPVFKKKRTCPDGACPHEEYTIWLLIAFYLLKVRIIVDLSIRDRHPSLVRSEVPLILA